MGCYSLTSGLRGVRADGPEHRREFFYTALAVALEAVEASCLEALEDLSICSLGLTVALWVRHRGEAELGAKSLAGEETRASGEATVSQERGKEGPGTPLNVKGQVESSHGHSGRGMAGAHALPLSPQGR